MAHNIKLFTVITILLCINSISCKPSFSLVIDTSYSMLDELNVIKDTISEVLKDISGYSYVSVLFGNEKVDSNIWTDHYEYLNYIYNITASTPNRNCRENALSAIQKSLELASPDPKSYVFVFTDAYPKDTSKLRAIQDLCQTTKNQVIIILTGSCIPASTSESKLDNVYFQIAKACHGGVYQFESDNASMKKAFTLMTKIVKTDWSEIKTSDIFMDKNTVEFTVDHITKDLMLAIYGKYASVQVFKTTPYSSSGVEYSYTPVIQTSLDLVVHLSPLQVGSYKAVIRSRGLTSATLYKHNRIPIQIGFSTKRTHFSKLTSFSPMPGWDNYILLVIPSPESSTLKLRSITLHNPKHSDINLPLQDDSEHEGHYFSKAYFDHDTTFHIAFSVEDTTNNQEYTGSTRILNTQKTLYQSEVSIPDSIPEAEIIPIQSVDEPMDSGSNLTFACKVTGFPQPQVTWQDGIIAEDILTIEVPNVFVTYATLYNLRNNDTIHCTARNSQGYDTKSLDLYAKNTFRFEVKQTPRDETIEFGSEGRLYCEVEAYPEATINWYHNDTLLDVYARDNIKIESQNQILLIKEMSLEDTGTYKCEVRNDYESKLYTAEVKISGLEAPQVELESTEISAKPGDSIEIDCAVKGKPAPNVDWKYRKVDARYFESLPEGVDVENGKMNIVSAKLEHAGMYRCEASNVIGQDYRDVQVKIQYIPIIKNVPDSLTINEGEEVELRCEVEASPDVAIRWEFYQNDVMVPLDGRFTTDDEHTLRFVALFKDTGMYHCIAENALGKAEKTVAVNVLVRLFIETPKNKNIITSVGSSLTLECNVKYGNPAPNTKWEFISSRSVKTVLARGGSELPLHLSDIRKNHEGTYTCKADNGFTIDSITINLKVL